ncbi:AMP-binding protein [Methylovulum psychrotolerans]|uniref:Non-ribosomal peptide synthetase n=1 Tax=Methylovulum psychrotolerans TaxID=1704499 RepID=A0A2S5CGY5_9GAMM|nr:AMP-binding protein [Methylovulum psychrotolerans]POZ50065.1 non-ribosomal peptide synthetase [Methylovulum psychrotolerans]
MSNELKPTPLAECALGLSPRAPVVFYQGQQISHIGFCQDVADRAGVFARQAQTDYALYYEEAYPFAVTLFALWHTGKAVWVAANNRPATAETLMRQGCALLGDWPSCHLKPLFESEAEVSQVLVPLDLRQSRLTFFTSGSTGHPQAIQKELWQLQTEVDTLERQWGEGLAQSQVLATVSHQHIYGLLFRVLWPLAGGRCFHSQTYLSPESLLKSAVRSLCPSYWVASPAQLKRLDEDLTPWSEMRLLKAIFSSGGMLDADVARQIAAHGGPKPIDIYGSSETGGIAWREPATEGRWLPFPGVGITAIGERHLLQSPYLPPSPPYLLQDRIELHQDGRFCLLGRNDRIVKIEEKRLSLTEMEQALQQSDWVDQAHCRLFGDGRVRVAALIVLTAKGLGHLRQEGRGAVIGQLKMRLSDTFENLVLPKKWLFMDSLPLSAQGKIDHEMIVGLLALDRRIFPELQLLSQQDGAVELSLRMQAGLLYFAGHFPGQPILPGVTQLVWAEKYGKLFFPIAKGFLSMEVVKFKKIIRPNDELILHLSWNADSGKLYFDFSSRIESHSSGRLLYGASL